MSLSSLKTLTYQEKIRCITLINNTLSFEGGYVNILQDKGGETYRGISRKAHPEWIGWKTIDAIKKERKIKKGEIINDVKLNDSVWRFYFDNYFSKVCGKLTFGDGNDGNVGLIHLLFDYSVHSGIKNAVKKFQKAINFYSPIKIAEDGILGSGTLTAFNAIGDYKKVGIKLLEYRREFLKAVAQTGTNSIFYYGWMNRCDYFVKWYKFKE